MDKTILNGSKIRFYNQGNSQSGSIQYTDSALIIKSNVTLGTSSANTIISNGKFTASAGIQSTFVSGSGLFTSNTGFTTSDYAKIGGVITAGSHINSPTFLPGYTGYGWMISKSTIPSTRYTAIFDDLWVRGSMNVYEMVINQIRSTNGSLWISDASKATSASYSSAANALILQFQTGSLVPFIAGDIIRSKRWGTSGSTILSQWDITTTISNINYITGYATISAPLSNNDYTITGSSNGSWTQLAQKLSVSGSQWVRVGNISQFSNRRGSIYLTSNDLGGPFIDVYDNVTSSVEATGGSGNVSGSKTKVRLGNLSGITDLNISPNPLSGYGLYADNVYLRGTVSATQGTFSGTVYARDGVFSGSISSSAGQIADWSIQEDNFNNGNLYLGQSDFYSQDGDIFIGAVNDQGYINFGNKLIFSNSSLAIDGTISAEAGTIGGWQISNAQLKSNDNNFVLDSANKTITISANNALRIGHFNLPPLQSVSVITNNLDLSQWDGSSHPYWSKSLVGYEYAPTQEYQNYIYCRLFGEDLTSSIICENAITGSIRNDQRIDYTVKVAIYAVPSFPYSPEAVFTFYIKSGNTIISSMSFTELELANMGATYSYAQRNYVKLSKTQIIHGDYSNLKFGFSWSGSSGIPEATYDLRFYGGSFCILDRSPEAYISHQGLHFQYGATDKYIRLSSQESKLSNIQIDSELFELGYQGQLRGMLILLP